MTYTSLMVYMDLGSVNESALRMGRYLAEQFGTAAIGVAACQPLTVAYGDGYVPAELIAADQEQVEKEMKTAEDRFRAFFQGRCRQLDWRSTVTFGAPADYVTAQARRADLIIASPGESTHVNIGDLVMRAGRPVLLVPDADGPNADEPNPGAHDLGSVLVGWKDTRETRRAVLDALPLLKRAGLVTVAEIADKDELVSARVRVADVAEWLKGHNVEAETRPCRATAMTPRCSTAWRIIRRRVCWSLAPTAIAGCANGYWAA